MRPAWLARTLVWAGVLLYIYWALLQNNREGATFAVGLLLGAGTLVYNGKPRAVPVILVLTAVVAMMQLGAKNATNPAAFFTGYLIGLLSPLAAWYLSRRK